MSFILKVYDKQLKCIELEANKQDNLMQVLGRNGIFFDANCGGQGRCRKCEVLVDGRKRKACKYQVSKDCKVYVPFPFQSQMDTILVEDTSLDCNHANEISRKEVDSDTYRLIVDVGTTTIGAALINADNAIIKQAGTVNSQRMYGADVASRIVYASDENGLVTLKRCLYQDIQLVLKTILDENKLLPEKVTDIYLTGNTVMLNIANGISPESIGRYPFQPLDKNAHSHEEVFWNKIAYPVHTFMCASGYIGSDVLLGAYYYNLHQEKSTVLYIDLGTNGEMLLTHKSRLYSASVAAGPAFEQVMHGSNIMKLLAELLDSGNMDVHGTLKEPYFSKGLQYKQSKVTQDDIRQIQLAKAALRAGINIICSRARCELTEVDKIYLAGGFGFYLQLEDVYRIGMFPDCFKGKVVTVGNASLQAAASLCMTADQYDKYTNHIETIDLSLDENFLTEYMNYIEFKKSK